MKIACPECNGKELITISGLYQDRQAVSIACQLNDDGECPLCKKAWDIDIGENGRLHTISLRII